MRTHISSIQFYTDWLQFNFCSKDEFFCMFSFSFPPFYSNFFLLPFTLFVIMLAVYVLPMYESQCTSPNVRVSMYNTFVIGEQCSKCTHLVRYKIICKRCYATYIASTERSISKQNVSTYLIVGKPPIMFRQILLQEIKTS